MPSARAAVAVAVLGWAMPFTNPARPDIERLLATARTIAVIGLSDNPLRPSHGVSAAMQRWGYRILPVNPAIAAALGEPAHATLAEALASLGPGGTIDIVNVFRRPAHVTRVVDQCLALGLPALWLQDGVVDQASALRARAAGMFVVMDRCIMRDRAAM